MKTLETYLRDRKLLKKFKKEYTSEDREAWGGPTEDLKFSEYLNIMGEHPNAISLAFHWSQSKKGFDFWQKESDDYQRRLKLIKMNKDLKG